MSGALAAVILVVWAAGITVMTVLAPSFLRENPRAQLGAAVRPEVTALLLALIIVAWPAIPIARALSALVDWSRS